MTLVRSSPKAEETTLDPGLVTVIVPAKNEEASIGRCLDSILSQDDANLQVVVVDGRSADRTADIVRDYARRDPRVELIDNLAVASIPASLNAALRAARGEWLVRVDAHSTIPSGYIRRAVDHLRTRQWGGVGGRKEGVGSTPAGRAIAAVMGSRFGVGNSVYHYGQRMQTVDHVPFGAYPTALVRQMGGWDERLVANEDFELDYRLRSRGYRLLFDPGLSIDWECRQRVMDLFRQYQRYGKGKARVARLHPASLSLRHLAPPMLAAMSVAAAVTGLRRPRLAGAMLAPYLLVLAVASAATGRRLEGLPARARVPAAFVAMHLGWGIGFWQGLAADLRRQLRRAT